MRKTQRISHPTNNRQECPQQYMCPHLNNTVGSTPTKSPTTPTNECANEVAAQRGSRTNGDKAPTRTNNHLSSHTTHTKVEVVILVGAEETAAEAEADEDKVAAAEEAGVTNPRMATS